MNEGDTARAHFCRTRTTFVFEGTVSLLLSFVFSDSSGNFPDFTRAEPGLSLWEGVELSFVCSQRAELQGLGSWRDQRPLEHEGMLV